MKTKIWLFFLLLFLGLSCRKDSSTNAPAPSAVDDQPAFTLAEAQTWYNHQTGLQTTGSLQTFNLSKLQLNWSNATSIQHAQSNYWLLNLPGQPTIHTVKQGYRKIALLKDSTGLIRARILEIVPDARYWLTKGRVTTADFTGYVYIYDENYHFLGGKIYAGGRQVGLSKPKNATGTNSSGLKTNKVYIYQDCEWYDSNYRDADGNVVIHSDLICDQMVFDDGFYPDMGGGGGGSVSGGDALGGGGGGGAPTPAPPAPPAVEELPGENNPGIKPVDYIKCFETLPDAGATMQVTVYVQAPQPGTAFPLGVNGVGHTAIGLSKSYQGTTINQVMGFYPQSHSEILSGASKMIDNSNMAFNNSITYTVTAAQFDQITAYMANPPAVYELYNFNCTSFVINAMQKGGITLPNADTIVGMDGAGGLAHANTPGGLGDSLNSMQGHSNVNNNGGRMPASHGACN